MKGKLYIISGPSGVGKNTLLNRVVAHRENLQYSVSATSRAIRPGEVDGKSYYFVTREHFESLIRDGELLEYAEYVGNYYGTPLAPIRTLLEKGVDVTTDLDVVGALKVKQRLPDAVLVFVAAPSFEALKKRLTGRGDVSPQAMEKRLARARFEYSQARHYDYIIVNDDVERAEQELLAIMTAEQCKTNHRIQFIEEENLCSIPQCPNC